MGGTGCAHRRRRRDELGPRPLLAKLGITFHIIDKTAEPTPTPVRSATKTGIVQEFRTTDNGNVAGAHGNVAPIAVISGSNTQLSQIAQIALH